MHIYNTNLHKFYVLEVWKGGFQLMQILDLYSMYSDAVVVFVMKSLNLFK